MAKRYSPPAWAMWPTSPPVKPETAPSVLHEDRRQEVAEIMGLKPTGDPVKRALAYINAKRRGVQPELDPKEAGWLDSDVIAEAQRLGWKG